ncbi:MAG: DNA recombination protein RmuC [Solirubrobacterales bacterium]
MTIALAIGFGALLGVLIGLWLRSRGRSAEQTTGLADQIKALTSDSLREATGQLLAQSREMRETDRKLSEAALKERETEIRGFAEQIAKGQKRIEDEVKGRKQTDEATRALLEQMRHGMDGLTSETANLKKALRQPHTRGRWGEVQLRRCIEIAGMTEHVDFVLERTFKDDEVWLRPDALFLLPGERSIVADSKVPLDAYLEALEAEDEAGRRTEMERHARQAREHVRKLGSKRYQDQFKTGETPDFVVCFFPSEPALHAAFEADPKLYEQAFDDGVLIATPTTLIGLLRTIEIGWRQERIADEALQIAEAARELHGRFGKFLADVAKLGKRLASATGAYNDAVGSLEARVLPQLRRVEDLGAASGKELEQPAPVDQAVRPISAPELPRIAQDQHEDAA